MKEHLTNYVELLFAGAPGTEDIKQEILQNTLDRYDDLVAQGKSPQAAYSLAISGIGDISEILGQAAPAAPTPVMDPSRRIRPEYRSAPLWKKLLRAAAVFLYIISIIPLFVLSEFGMEVLGLCGMFALVGVATALIIIAGGSSKAQPTQSPETLTPWQELQKAIRSIVSVVTVCVYLIVSFATGAWWITWLVFPIAAAVKGLIKAILDLKEACQHES